MVGLAVPFVPMLWGLLLITLEYIPASISVQNFLFSPLVTTATYAIPAGIFAWHADRTAWSANPDRWTPHRYLVSQRWWTLAGVIWVALGYADIRTF